MEALRKAKDLLHNVLIPIALACNVSSYGLGAILSHQLESDEQPIAFHSLA